MTLALAAEALASSLRSAAGTPIVYRRPGVGEVNLIATIGRSEHSIETEIGIERFHTRDYLIATGDLVLGGVATLPKLGDVIEETIGSQTYQYQVMAPDNSTFYQFSDRQRTILRVHTKQVNGA